MKHFLLIITIVVIVVFSGCAISRKVPYQKMAINLPQTSNESLSISVWDQREQVVEGKRKSDFVGYLRSGAGIAYPMGTESGYDFAEVIANEICSSAKKNRKKCIVVSSHYNGNLNSLLNKLKETSNDKLVLLKCNKLHTDGYANETLFYNIDVSVYDRNGNILAEKSFVGDKELGAGMKYKEYMPYGLEQLIEEIFNNSIIYNALKKQEINDNLGNSMYSAPQNTNDSVNKEQQDRNESISKNSTAVTDVIYLNDGLEIKSKIIEITESTIIYKVANDVNGAVMKVAKDKVFMIIYKNGQYEIFKHFK